MRNPVLVQAEVKILGRLQRRGRRDAAGNRRLRQRRRRLSQNVVHVDVEVAPELVRHTAAELSLRPDPESRKTLVGRLRYRTEEKPERNRNKTGTKPVQNGSMTSNNQSKSLIVSARGRSGKFQQMSKPIGGWRIFSTKGKSGRRLKCTEAETEVEAEAEAEAESSSKLTKFEEISRNQPEAISHKEI